MVHDHYPHVLDLLHTCWSGATFRRRRTASEIAKIATARVADVIVDILEARVNRNAQEISSKQLKAVVVEALSEEVSLQVWRDAVAFAKEDVNG